MQKLDLGVEYNEDKGNASSGSEPLTAEPPASPAAAKTAPIPKTTPAATSTPTKTAENPKSVPTKTNTSMKKTTSTATIVIAVVAIIAGSATGVGAFRLQSQSDPLVSGGPIQQVAGDSIENGQVFGSADASTFKDSAEGYLQVGGIQGEGSHSLLRPGGADQTVYLVSTVTNLDDFEGMNIKVWGETYEGQKAGWLMDVGRVQVVDTQGTAPTEE